MHMKIARGDLLARAYLDMLAAEAGANGRPMLRSRDSEDPIELLIDDLAATPDSVRRTAIRADLAATAVVVARAIESVEGLTVDLRRGRPVVVIATHDAELVSPAFDVMETCAFGDDATVMNEASFGSRSSRPVLLMSRDGTGKDHKSDRGNECIAKALHAGGPVVGIAPDPRRHLPRDLLRAAEHHLALKQLDASAISLVIELVTGSPPSKEIEQDLVRAVDISDLALSIRSDRGPDECIDRLERIIATKGEFEHRGPRLEELAGYGEARQWGLNLVADLREYRAGRLDWDSLEKGLLLVGPPGTGKTQFAKALAKSANIPLVATSVADWNAASLLSGTLSAIKASFARARQLAPCLLFIDELDGISDRATLPNEYREYWTQIINLVLELLAGIDDRPGVIVLGCTNHVHRIDAAVRRSGRLDRTIEIGLPGVEDLAQIFRHHLGPDVLPGADLMPAALAAVGKTGADVEAWVRRAKSGARREGRPFTIDDVVREVREGRSRLPDGLRRVAAVHEAGHLVVGVALEVFEPQALGILDQGGTTRVALTQENQQSERGIENFITSLLGGRAAEIVVLGPDNATAGAGIGEDSDFALATKAVVDLELRFGFGKLGVAHFSERTTEMMLQQPEVQRLLKKRLDRCLDRSILLVRQNRGVVERVAARLQEREYLDRNSIKALLAEHPLSMPGEEPSL